MQNPEILPSSPNSCFWSQTNLGLSLSSAIIICVNLDDWFNLSRPNFLTDKMGIITVSVHLIVLKWEKMYKFLNTESFTCTIILPQEMVVGPPQWVLKVVTLSWQHFLLLEDEELRGEGLALIWRGSKCQSWNLRSLWNFSPHWVLGTPKCLRRRKHGWAQVWCPYTTLEWAWSRCDTCHWAGVPLKTRLSKPLNSLNCSFPLMLRENK